MASVWATSRFSKTLYVLSLWKNVGTIISSPDGTVQKSSPKPAKNLECYSNLSDICCTRIPNIYCLLFFYQS